MGYRIFFLPYLVAAGVLLACLVALGVVVLKQAALSRAAVPDAVKELRAATAARVCYRDAQGFRRQCTLPPEKTRRLLDELRPRRVYANVKAAFTPHDDGLTFLFDDGRSVHVVVCSDVCLYHEGGGMLIFLEDGRFTEVLDALASEFHGEPVRVRAEGRRRWE